MELCDLRAISDVCHLHGAEVVVDNTFMSPYFQRPIEFGADMVVHSTTKFLNGHSDGLGGVVVCTKPEQAEKLAFFKKCAGAIMSPFECWLILRGVKTLAVRMVHTTSMVARLPTICRSIKKVQKVFIRITRPSAARVCETADDGFGSMISFETGSLSNANKMLRKVRICSLAESLGGVETLISHPATMTHAALGEEGRAKIGITDGMVRISVGIEDVDDILADLDQALAAISATRVPGNRLH